MNYVLVYTLLGCFAGFSFALTQSFMQGGLSREFVVCIGIAALGGLVPGLLRQATRRYIPLIQSWVTIILIVLCLPLILAKTFLGTAFVYGYLFHLLWEAYHHKLPRV